jgi:hypothetical protein
VRKTNEDKLVTFKRNKNDFKDKITYYKNRMSKNFNVKKMNPKRDLKRNECCKYINLTKNYTQNELPVTLYSFRVYLAHKGLWKLINRDLITNEEIIIMKNLNIYKYPRRYKGNKLNFFT